MQDSLNSDKFLVFELGGRCCGLPVAQVREVLPMCRLIQTIGLPSALAGFLNLRGDLTPLVRLDRLFGLEEAAFHLYTHIVVAKRAPSLALSVERAQDILVFDPGVSMEAPKENVFGECLEGVIQTGSRDVSLLRLDRIILEEEMSRIAELTRMAAERLKQLTEPSN